MRKTLITSTPLYLLKELKSSTPSTLQPFNPFLVKKSILNVGNLLSCAFQY